MTRFQNVGVLIGEKVWLENSLSQQEGGWQGSGGVRVQKQVPFS